MLKRTFMLALLSVLVMQTGLVLGQAVDPRQPPEALPVGSFFPPSFPSPPPIAPASTVPVEYLPSEMGSLGIAEDEFVPRLWLDTEAVLWRVRKGKLNVPLITTGPANSFGIIGRTGTTVLNSSSVDFDTMLGARAMAGLWYDDSHFCGLEGGFTWFGTHNENQTFSSNATGTPLLARPFRDAATNRESVRTIASPGAFAGSASINSTISLWGAEFSPIVLRLDQGERHYVYGIMGFKYFNFNDRLAISDSVRTLAGGQTSFNGVGFGAGSRESVTDSFDASNDLYGGQLGARFGYDYNRFFFDGTAKIGLMHNHQVLVDSGGTVIVAPPTYRRPTGAPLGLLVGQFNARRESQAQFAVMPELNAQLGFQLTTRMSIIVGYNFLYISSVIRPGDQIVRNVNTGLAPSSPSFGANVSSKQPMPTFIKDEFSAMGLSFGLSVRY